MNDEEKQEPLNLQNTTTISVSQPCPYCAPRCPHCGRPYMHGYPYWPTGPVWTTTTGPSQFTFTS